MRRKLLCTPVAMVAPVVLTKFDGDTMTSHDLPQPPISRRTIAATAALPENLLPPRIRNQTSDGIILCLPAQQMTSAETINPQTKATAMPPRNLTSLDSVTSLDLPNQPIWQRTLVTAADSVENLVPPHQNRTPDGIILCLPAERKTSAETINFQTKATTKTTKNLTSSQHRVTKVNSVTFWTSCHRCRMHYEYLNIFMGRELLCHGCEFPFMATEITAPKAKKSFPVSDARTAPGPSGRHAQVKKGDDALLPNTFTSFTACSSGVEGKQTVKIRRLYSAGNTGVPSQRNFPRRPKELPWNHIRQMLMDKARTEILLYLNN